MRLRPRLRGLGLTLWRLALALALLAVLFFGTRGGIRTSTDRIEVERQADRLSVVTVLAVPLTDWLETGLGEATGLATDVAHGVRDQARGRIDAFLASRPAFAVDALLVRTSGEVVAASRSLRALEGRRPPACELVEAEGSERDASFAGLVAAVADRARPLLSSSVRVPGECSTTWVAAAARSGGNVVVVLGPAERGLARTGAVRLMEDRTDAGADVMLYDPRPDEGPLVLGANAEPRAAPTRIVELVRSTEAGRPTRYELGDDASVERIGVWRPVTPIVGDAAATVHGEPWSLVLEEDAGAFELAPQDDPANVVAALLVVVFGVVLALVLWLDVRRQRAYRRSEVAKNAFFSVAGHELRTPLTSLKGFLETMAMRWDDLGDDQKHMLVERMLPQARRLDRLVERLLVAASIQAQTHTHPQVTEVAVGQTLERVADAFAAEAPLHTFEVHTDDALPDAVADPAALEQVLRHVVDNAVKYSPSGGRIWLRARSDRRGVHIAIEDEGVGLPADHRRIFEPLVQGEGVTKRVHDEGGMGVGLYIVRTLVGEMGGTVRATPREPEGSRFIITLRAGRTRTERSSRTSD